MEFYRNRIEDVQLKTRSKVPLTDKRMEDSVKYILMVITIN